MCRTQCVKIHFVEFIVELLSKLPGQVIVAERSQRKGLTLTDSLKYLSVCLDSHWKLLPEVDFYDRRKVFAAADEVLKNIMQSPFYFRKKMFHLPIDERGLRHQLQSCDHVRIISPDEATRTSPQRQKNNGENCRQHFLKLFTLLNARLFFLCVPKFFFQFPQSKN